MNIDKSRTDIAMFEALFVRVKEVFLKSFFADFRNFLKIGRYLHGHNSFGLVFTLQKQSI